MVARDEGDDADGVVTKLYAEETNGAISIVEQPFEPGLLPDLKAAYTCASSASSSSGIA